MDDFAAGRLGALEYKSSPPSLMELKNRWDALNDKSFEDCVDVLPVFPAPDGIRYSNSSSSFWSESYISSNVDDTKAERILALFEFLLSDEGQDFCHYGLEGIDYEKDPVFWIQKEKALPQLLPENIHLLFCFPVLQPGAEAGKILKSMI